MLSSPRFPTRHPDSHIDCQEILEDRINIIMDDARAAGWSTEKTAFAIVELADNLILGHRANDDMEAVFDLARHQSWRWRFG